VHLYSISYIAEDPHKQRFFAYLSFFTASIIVLVTGDNYVVLFLGWEGIGIASFLLIGFWLTWVQANKAAVKALTVNRVGDIFLSIGLFALLWTCGSLEYASIYSVTPLINETAITIIALLLFAGAISKSAQVPFHTWLPDKVKNIGLLIYKLSFLKSTNDMNNKEDNDEMTWLTLSSQNTDNNSKFIVISYIWGLIKLSDTMMDEETIWWLISILIFQPTESNKINKLKTHSIFYIFRLPINT